STAGADVTITATTTPNGGQYAPRNIVATWIEDSTGAFVKTIDRWAQTRKGSLVAWNQKAGAGDADAVSGATRQNHTAPLTINWDLRDKAGNLVPDGTYTVRMELADSNANTAGQNHQGTFTFVKAAAPQSQAALANGGFTNVSIEFQPVSNTCNNGAVEAGETCDPAIADSCPTTCAASADACLPNNLTGSAASCNAACEVQPITACANDDGCCPDGCDGTDTDCGGGGAGPADLSGGCDAGSGASLGMVLLGFAFLVRRRQSR
ncbi:MAG: DUF2271 domain-containing protein, partial [Kofleriaceae bacterium]